MSFATHMASFYCPYYTMLPLYIIVKDVEEMLTPKTYSQK